MSQAGPISSSGGGGGDVTLVPDSGGGITGSSINVFGQQADTTPVMDTLNSAGDFLIENRTWQTKYVVDASTTEGTRATFSTIQDAFDQITTDHGISPKVAYCVFIRPGIYTENPVIPNSVRIIIEADVANSAYIIGDLTGGTGGNITLQNINVADLFGAGGDVDLSGAVNTWIYNCSFYSFTASGGTHRAYNSDLANSTVCTLTGGSLLAQSSQALSLVMTDAIGSFFDCSLGNPVTFSGASIISIFGGLTSNTITVEDTTSLYFENLTSTATNIVTASDDAIVSYSKVTSRSPGNVLSVVSLSGNATASSFPTTGSTVKLRRTDVTGTVSVTGYDQYIGLGAAPSAVSLPNNASGNVWLKDQVVIIKDESGDATADPQVITPTVPALIDGVTSKSISTDYGSYQILFDGTDYWTF